MSVNLDLTCEGFSREKSLQTSLTQSLLQKMEEQETLLTMFHKTNMYNRTPKPKVTNIILIELIKTTWLPYDYSSLKQCLGTYINDAS